MRVWMIALVGGCLLSSTATADGTDLSACRQLLIRGEYHECIKAAADGIAAHPEDEAWHALKAEAECITGGSEEARETIKAGLKRCPASLRLRLLRHRLLQRLGNFEQAREELAEIDRLAQKTPWRYTGADDLLALGEAALVAGGDPRQVLRDFFERARKQSPDSAEAWLACADLTLELHGPNRAVRLYEEGLKRFPTDPDLHFGLARALAAVDPAGAAAKLERALELNPRHVEALLFEADRLITIERWTEAREILDRVLVVNPRETDAWAFRAVLAHLQGNPQDEAACRAAACSESNPTVDHLVGLKLSQHYRFREAAACQRRALRMDPGFIPARIQLSQDLLRLGDEAEAWKVAEEARRQAGEHPAVMNLLELRDRIARFRTLEDEHFVVRMEAREADVYGERVLALLNRARQTLGAKYGVELKEKIIVEIFPDEADFAVRSFGMPSPAGYLAVCFGKVITAGSPAARTDRPVNWEAILWHEFCHSVTLELTHHRMPRWLSEGISVYEEQQENPAWGQRMTPPFRAMVLEGELIPIADMGEAFAAPKGPLHVQFAYYEAGLFVEFLVERFGFEALEALLRDLGAGLTFTAALERHTAPLPKIEQEFAEFARRRAEELAPDADWTHPDLGELLSGDEAALERWLREHPNNLPALHAFAHRLMSRRAYEQAKEPLQRLIALDPGHVGPGSPYALLAQVHRELKDSVEERRMLRQVVEKDAAALDACRRLLELDLAAEDWSAALKTAERMLAINPLQPEPYRAVAQAAEKLGQAERALAARRALEHMRPSRPVQSAADVRGVSRE